MATTKTKTIELMSWSELTETQKEQAYYKMAPDWYDLDAQWAWQDAKANLAAQLDLDSSDLDFDCDDRYGWYVVRFTVNLGYIVCNMVMGRTAHNDAYNKTEVYSEDCSYTLSHKNNQRIQDFLENKYMPAVQEWVKSCQDAYSYYGSVEHLAEVADANDWTFRADTLRLELV